MSEKVEKMLAAIQELSVELYSATEDNYTELIIPYLRQECSDFEWSYDAGISKMVILIRGEPQVIKIPFHNLMDSDSYQEELAYWENEADQETDEEPQEERFVYEFVDAYNESVEQALGLQFKGNDYCEIECAVYELAEANGLDQYFAKTEWCAEADDTDIYLQQRVTPLEINGEKTTMASMLETSKKCDSLGVRCFNAVWINDFFNIYGEEEFKKLDAFLKKYNIYDLHAGNLGYLDGMPIILDYSDFNEW